jgi:hypothetical protein
MGDLANALDIETELDEHRNWRFNPTERMMFALFCLSNYIVSRKARLTWGWAANSLRINMFEFVDCVIDKLDAAGFCNFLSFAPR